MRLTNLVTSTVLLCAMCCVCGQAQQLPSALTTDPPHDKAFPAEMETSAPSSPSRPATGSTVIPSWPVNSAPRRPLPQG